jgi:hypothetical protein
MNEGFRFADIFAEEDALGLLSSKPVAPARSSEDMIVMGQFEAINVFIDANGVLPGSSHNGRNPSFAEFSLEGNLEAFRADSKYREILGPLDRHGLLGPASAVTVPTRMDEILASNDPLLTGPADEIFTLKHVADAKAKISSPDEVAQRRPCRDFERFEPIFAEIKADLKAGRRRTIRFEGETTIKPGAAFILGGIIAYVASEDERSLQGNRYNGRTRVIFDNGTEANYLWRSFARAFYQDVNSREILETAPIASGPLFGGPGQVPGPLFSGEAPSDGFGEVKGTVYIVESSSEDPNIAALKGRLFKIGFTTQEVNKRLADVEKDPTFLCAPVKLRATYETNFSPRKLEQLLHQFFAHANLQIDVVLGRHVQPKEWFVVPLDLVEEAVRRILDRSIVDYRYDPVSRKILAR